MEAMGIVLYMGISILGLSIAAMGIEATAFLTNKRIRQYWEKGISK